MKKIVLFTMVVLALFEAKSQDKKTKEKFGLGFYRVSYINVYNCKTEFQSFDSTINDAKLDKMMSFLYRIGSKDRGIENEFKTYFAYDYTKKSDTKEKLITYSKQQVRDFEASVDKLRKTYVPLEFEPLKTELLQIHGKRLAFEKIIADWYADGNDEIFRKRITDYYSDVYIIATLDKTLALKDMDKMRFTYAELYDIMFAKVFNYQRVIEIQNYLMHRYKIEVVIDPNCTKS